MPTTENIPNATRWATASSAGRIVMQVVQLVVLARLLASSDFGTMAVITSIIAIINLLADFGIGRPLMFYKNINHLQLSSLYWVNFGFSLILLFTLTLLSQAIGNIYDYPELKNLLAAAAFLFPVLAVGFQYRILAEKNLQFKSLALIEIISSFLGVVAAIVTALNDGGAWAFVNGLLVQGVSLSLLSLLFLSNEWKPSLKFSLTESKIMLKFGVLSIGEALLNMFRHQSDILIAGLFVTPSALGYYSFAREICLKTGPVIGQILNRVALPLMTKYQDNIDKVREYYLLVLLANCSINFPIYIFLGVFSSEVISTIFGNTWDKSAALLSILSIYGLLRATSHPLGNLIYSTGNIKLGFIWNLLLAIVIPSILFVTTMKYLEFGLAWAQAGSLGILLIPTWLFIVRPLIKTNLMVYLGQMLMPLLVSLISIAPALLVSQAATNNFYSLTAAGLVFAFSYFVLSYYLNGKARDMLKNAITR